MHQYLFYIGDFPIRAYGLVLSLSIILATGVGYFLTKADGRGYEKYIVDLGIYCGVAGLLGARLWDVFFFDWDYYGHHLTELLNVWQGGMAIQGGVFLGVLTGVWYCHRHHLDTVHLMDVLAPAIILGQALGRCANLLNGDAFGAPTGSSSASSIRRPRSPTTRTATSRSGRLKSGKDSSTSSSSHCSCSSARQATPRASASPSTSCSTASRASGSNSCAAITPKKYSASSRAPRPRASPPS